VKGDAGRAHVRGPEMKRPVANLSDSRARTRKEEKKLEETTKRRLEESLRCHILKPDFCNVQDLSRKPKFMQLWHWLDYTAT
jgi:hypothetical protein